MGRVPYPSINLILYRINISRDHMEDLGKLFNLTLRRDTTKDNIRVSSVKVNTHRVLKERPKRTNSKMLHFTE